MAKRKTTKKLGALGPAAHWLDLTVGAREATKRYIKEGFLGYIRGDGVSIPGARRIFSGLDASDGYDLSHIERWSAARLARARTRVQALNTLTSRNFQVLTPRNRKQRIAAQHFTGQDLAHQKAYIVQVQNKKDRTTFKKNRVTVERQFKEGSRQIKQRYLFVDYLGYSIKSGEKRRDEMPVTFHQMIKITKRMLADMPSKYRGQEVYYTVLTAQYGSVGQSVFKEKVLEILAKYHSTYGSDVMHQGFAETVIGFSMVGTYAQAAAFQDQRDELRRRRRQLKKLRFTKRQR